MSNSSSRRVFARYGLGIAAALAAASTLRAQVAITREALWSDLSSQRDVPILMRWPTGQGPCGLVIYSHGLGGSRLGADAWGEVWAQAGLAVIHVQHPGSDSTLWRAANPAQALKEAASARELAARVGDVRFVLGEVERRQKQGQSDFSRVRLDAIGMAGHSFGAQTTQALAGQRDVPGQPSLSEPRFKAFAAFSPNARRSRSNPSEQFGAIKRPFLCLTGSLDGDPFGAFKTPEPRVAVFDGLAAGNKAMLLLDKADHGTLAGTRVPLAVSSAAAALLRRDAQSLALEAQHHALAAQITTLWWQAHLLGDAKAAAALLVPPRLAATDTWRVK